MTATMPLLGSNLFGDLLSSSSTRRPRALSEVTSDQRGAVMLTGLFMACFLIGSLWFVIGIGDSVVFRDKMQEAADHGAFSSAALQAKGLNFICLINLIMLALVTVHIIMGIVNDILFLVCITAGIESFGTACIPYIEWHEDWTSYFNIMHPALTGLHDAAEVARFAYPYIGLIEGIEIGHTYKGPDSSQVTVLPVGESLAGLPLEAQPMNYLCLKLADDLVDLLKPITKFIPSFAKKFIEEVVGKGIQMRYCNSEGGATGKFGDAAAAATQAKLDQANKKIEDDNKKNGTDTKTFSGAGINGLDPGFNSFWGTNGPFIVNSKSANGGNSFQVFAINFMPSFNDKESESHVGIGRGPTDASKNANSGLHKYTTQVKAIGYLAQAEFYFDCNDKWASDTCNNKDNAMFTIGWRARLKPFSLGSSIDKIASFAVNGLADIGNIVGLGDVASNVLGAAGGLLSGTVGPGTPALVNAFEQIPSDLKNITGH